MTIRDAVRIAETKGYVFDTSASHPIEIVLLDKDFWEALGRGFGWPYKNVEMVTYKTQWHRCIDHLAEGKTPAEFFATLSE
jgi:hypothetical protein